MEAEQGSQPNKRRRLSSSPLFVQQDEEDDEVPEQHMRRHRSSSPLFVQQDEEDPQDTQSRTDLKRKIRPSSKTSNSSPEQPNMSIKAALSEMINQAPAGQRHNSTTDGAMVLHATKQFPPGHVRYAGNGLWKVTGMKTLLKTHQLINVGWMLERERRKKNPCGGILADQMGLGKTLCALTAMTQGKLMSSSQKNQTVLVVVTKAIKDQWFLEAQEHAASNIGLKSIYTYNSSVGRKVNLAQFGTHDLVIASYPELCKSFRLCDITYPAELTDEEKCIYFEKHIRHKLGALHRFKFKSVYLDEGHQIRNPSTNYALAANKIQAKNRWILTGTPITNKAEDLYSLLCFIKHPIVSSLTLKEFKVYYYSGPNNTVDNKWLAGLMAPAMRCSTFKTKLFGVYLTDIPTPVKIKLAKPLSVPEDVIYTVVSNRLQQLAKEKLTNPDENKSYKYVAGLLMVLRQMSGHVLSIRESIFEMLTEEDVNAIYDGIYKATDPVKPHDQKQIGGTLGPKPVVVDKHADDYMAAIRKLQGGSKCASCDKQATDARWAECGHAYCYACLEAEMHATAARDGVQTRCKICKSAIGEVQKEHPNDGPNWLNAQGVPIPSMKSTEVIGQIKYWRHYLIGDPAVKIVIFTTFRETLRFLSATFEQQGWLFTTLTSSMSSEERANSVQAFETQPDCFIMLANSGVGGQGLNLTVAARLINYDQYFNEAAEIQAEGRIYRIGQTEKTEMVTIAAKNTVDDHIINIREQKTIKIRKVMNASKKERTKSVLKMFKKMNKNNQVSIWESDLEAEEDEA
jgi:SNF2 family DNA or RNA helicase